MRTYYRWDKEKQEMVMVYRTGYQNKSAFVHQDTVEAFESLATPDKQMFDSMSAYKRHLKEHGYEITGGEHLTGRGMQDFKADVPIEEIEKTTAECVQKAEWGMAPLTDMEKERCHREQRQMNEYMKRNRIR